MLIWLIGIGLFGLGAALYKIGKEGFIEGLGGGLIIVALLFNFALGLCCVIWSSSSIEATYQTITNEWNAADNVITISTLEGSSLNEDKAFRLGLDHLKSEVISYNEEWTWANINKDNPLIGKIIPQIHNSKIIILKEVN